MVMGVKIISTDKERACKSCMDIKPHAGVSHETWMTRGILEMKVLNQALEFSGVTF